MTSPESSSSGQELVWVEINPAEEADRVERHLAMAQDMLDTKEEGEGTIVKISFGRYLEAGDLFTYAPGEHMGILIGVQDSEQPALIIANYEVFLVEVDPETDEITTEILIDSADIATVPVREIGDFSGATGRPSDWEALGRLKDSK